MIIRELRIINFKSHKDTHLHFGNLTVLSGQNGVGKSSIIQALLLLRQTHQKSRLDHILDLNSPLCFIGKAKDALYKYPNEEFRNQLGIVLKGDKYDYSWIFEDKSNKSYLERINDLVDSDGFQSLSLFSNQFQYLSAYRSNEYLVDDYAVEFQKQISINEGKGELVAQFLTEYGKKIKVLEELKHTSENDTFLLSQVIAWEREISKNVNINPVSYQEGGYEIKFSFDTLNTSIGPVDDLSKKNVGHGLSYVLPVITAILSAERGALIIIENPEAHIHPYGISKLTELICLGAQAGIQIIVETHSDHVINGVLVQCKKFENQNKGINRENLKMYYFDRDESEHKTIKKEIDVLEGGRIRNREIGFFDQIGKDLRELI